MVADAICDRIYWLVHTQLEAVAAREAGWTTLYRDPRDGRLWEHSYPKSEMHGGGPPMLQFIDETAFTDRYCPISS
ncbi:Imm27 family immunity protein [Rhizorhabdus phycosphaerae]|uniref:Imm27 family immunity protein n=1 Tax=Rhizorhabdus phycosphaerae TaxID=2711156 RepID=UPI001D027AFE